MSDDPTCFWVPEAPEHPGVYAYNAPNPKKNCTMDIVQAMQFKTQAECQAWCTANPVPPFVPREHGWAR